MAKILGRMIGEDIVLECKLNNSTRGVLADPSQIEQVLMNLAINARDAMPKGGRLTIETTDVEFGDHNIDYSKEIKPGAYTMISVSDTGCGMPKKIQRKIFEPFFTTKEKDKGTGLGLATVYGIIKQHNGYIYVYSEPAKGTTFKIYLPVMLDGELAHGEIVADAEMPKGTETIMVVEDESSLRKYIIDVLRPLGYKVLGAADGNEALRISADYAEEIHLLLTDFIMPGLNGHEVANTMQKDRPDMKVIIMSGYTDDIIAQHGVLAEGINFIQKPVTVSKMASKIRTVLDGE
jgi:CheY-like chemotaxis protein